MTAYPHKCLEDRSNKLGCQDSKVMANGAFSFLPNLERTQGRRKLSWAPLIVINTSTTNMRLEELREKTKKNSSYRTRVKVLG